MRFSCRATKIGKLPEYSQQIIKSEPMVFSASLGFADKYGGPITRAFLDRLPQDFRNNVIIDSRTHMLMPGWYPAIPGWHHDDVPRTAAFNQPNYTNPEYYAEHIAAFYGTASKTEYLIGSIEVPEPIISNSTTVYAQWHKHLESVSQGDRVFVDSGDMINFDWETFHRAPPATENGWRFFIRVTKNSKRPILNEQRIQTQVYLSSLNARW